MNAKKILSTLLLSATIMSTTFAAGADDELSIMAAEQRKNSSDTETFEEPEPVKPEPVKPSQPARVETPKVETPKVETPKVETPKVETPAVTRPQNARPAVEKPNTGMSNPITSHSTFEECAEELGFTPLYIPKQSGYTLNYISSIGGTVADLRFSRRWETQSNLTLRTYKRADGEELKDISGVHGVKWHIDMSGGVPIYLARIDENSNAAAWAVGQYTFAAMADNLSFAAFRTLVFEELVDLSAHYYVEF